MKDNPRVLAFIQHYVREGKSGAESARLAGYSEKSARYISRDLVKSNPVVLKAIEDSKPKPVESQFSTAKEAKANSELVAQGLPEMSSKVVHPPGLVPLVKPPFTDYERNRRPLSFRDYVEVTRPKQRIANGTGRLKKKGEW